MHSLVANFKKLSLLTRILIAVFSVIMFLYVVTFLWDRYYVFVDPDWLYQKKCGGHYVVFSAKHAYPDASNEMFLDLNNGNKKYCGGMMAPNEYPCEPVGCR